MSDRLSMVCGFLGGTIISVENGYKVFPHPKPDKIYSRLSDAKWFLSLRYCDCLTTPACIINNVGELAFVNQIVLRIKEDKFIPPQHRLQIFEQCLPLQPNETVNYQLPASDRTNLVTNLEIQSLSIDARYGKVALVRQLP